jgi:hypothetical protein
MNLTQALKAGILPSTSNPIEIILTAHNEGLEDLSQKQIRRHHRMMKNSRDANEARQKFQIICDFTDAELFNMNDMKIWAHDGDSVKAIKLNQQTNSLTGTISDMMNSVYIDDSSRSVQSLSLMQSSISILKSLRRKKIYRPVDDKTVTHCYNCGIAFTVFNRRHHCRACGRIFCHSCSQWNERIPDDLVSYTDTKSWIIQGQVSRVCQSCKDIIINFRKIESLVQYFEIVAYPFDLCIRASTLSRDWREAIRIYLSNIRDLQYSLPSTQLLDRDIRALRNNMQYLYGHNKWILQALKLGIIDINEKRVKQCHDMMCDRNCTEQLTSFDSIIILNTPIYNIEVKLLALKILENELFPSEIAMFLPIEDIPVQEFILKRSDLFLEFFWLSRINQGIASDIFKNKLLLANQDQAVHVQESINLISALGNYNDLYELSQKLQNLKTPFIGPFGVIDKFDSDITVKTSATRPIIIRYWSEGLKRALLYKQEDVRKDSHVVALIRLMYFLSKDIFITCKNSTFLPFSSSPIDITSGCDSGVWFSKNSPMSSPPKSEGLRLDSLGILTKSTHQDISTFSSSPLFKSHRCTSRSCIPKTTLSNDTHCGKKYSSYLEGDHNSKGNPGQIEDNISFLATYRVMPISTNSGFIEIVPNSSTLYEILSRGTISNYLYRSNIDKKVSEVSSNYSASLAFWTVVTYLLGVGDRHLENIMIRNDGVLFHIDYGFVFGVDSTASFVRLDNNLIEGLGGVEMYEPFKARCCEIYCCLRRHFNFICACLLRLASIKPPISGYNFTSEFIEKFVTERFLLGQTEEEAKEAFSNIIDASRETIYHRVSDAIHSTVSSLKVGWWGY